MTNDNQTKEEEPIVAGHQQGNSTELQKSEVGTNALREKTYSRIVAREMRNKKDAKNKNLHPQGKQLKPFYARSKQHSKSEHAKQVTSSNIPDQENLTQQEAVQSTNPLRERNFISIASRSRRARKTGKDSYVHPEDTNNVNGSNRLRERNFINIASRGRRVGKTGKDRYAHPKASNNVSGASGMNANDISGAVAVPGTDEVEETAPSDGFIPIIEPGAVAVPGIDEDGQNAWSSHFYDVEDIESGNKSLDVGSSKTSYEERKRPTASGEFPEEQRVTQDKGPPKSPRPSIRTCFCQPCFKKILACTILIGVVGVLTILALSSSSPSDADKRKSGIMDLLLDFTSQELLVEEGSPQNKAFEWLNGEGTLSPFKDEWKIKQQYALAAFYYATGGGDSRWTSSNDWLQASVDECDWEFITCEDDRGVKNITIKRNQLIGSLPDELAILTSLKTFDITGNHLSGTIGSFISSWENIWCFCLDENNFSGTIPQEWYKDLTSIGRLLLSKNDFTGSISAFIGNLLKLAHINLGGNSFVGSLPTELYSLTDLEYIQVQNNEFQGKLSSSIQNLRKLKELDVSNNNMNGSIPTFFGMLGKLSNLNLEKNDFTSTVPSEIGRLNLLEDFRFGFNDITGTIPQEVCDLHGDDPGAILYLECDEDACSPSNCCDECL